MRPVVHLYALCWNEAHMLPFFFRNYESWVQHFIIYDNGSTDGTVEFLSAKSNVELRQFPWTDPDSFLRSQHALHNQCWRESRGVADWVVVTAIDEHLYHPDIDEFLERCDRDGVTCVPALGHEMVTTEFPDPNAYLAAVHTRGVPSPPLNKLRLFKPDQLEPRFAIGGHGATPTGHVVYPDRDELLLLHYKYLGFEYVAERSRLLDTGLRDGDRAKNWGRHYRRDRSELERVFERLQRDAVDIRGPHYVAWRDYPHRRFWRAPAASSAGAKRQTRLHKLWIWLKRCLRVRRRPSRPGP